MIEYATLGLLSALTGTMLAVGASSVPASLVFKTSPYPEANPLVIAFLTTIVISIFGGLALSRGVSNYPPLDILRHT